MKVILKILVILLITSCGSSPKPQGQSQSNTEDQINRGAQLESQYCSEISNRKNLEIDQEILKPTQILDYRLQDACICLVYQYSGCEESGSVLSWDGHWPSEFEPIIKLQLQVIEPGMCDMLLTDSACFSIKKLSFGGDKIHLILNEAQNKLEVDFTKL